MKHYNNYKNSVQNQDEAKIPDVIFSRSAFNKIEKNIGGLPAENGCLLLGYEEEMNQDKIIVRDIILDQGASTTRVTYSLNIKYLNPLIKQAYKERGLSVIGIDHSHPQNFNRPSWPDMEYFRSQLLKMHRKYFVVPITLTKPDGGFKQFVYVMTGPDSDAIMVDYTVVDDALLPAIPKFNTVEAQPSADTLASATEVANANAPVTDTPEVTTQTSETLPAEETAAIENNEAKEDKAPGIINKDETVNEEPEIVKTYPAESVATPFVMNYDRINGAYDRDKLKKAIIAGTGGAYCLAEMYARAGFKTIVLIDPDTADDVNICRQGFTPKNLGRKKVEALAEHLRIINPEVEVITYPVKIQELTPKQEYGIFHDASIAIFTTDSFDAQAYGNKLVLRHGIPGIWAGFYKDSLAAEVIFYMPGITPACFRCITRTRFEYQAKAKAENGKEFRVSSNSNTIFHSAYLDSVIGMLTLAILNNDTEGKTYSNWFGSYWDRNLLQIKVNPAYSTNTFKRTFDAAGESAFLFETVWQKVQRETPPDYAPCPDCCGENWSEETMTTSGNTSEEKVPAA